ncbi:XRE family transcriptional regulator [Granulosicoccaceae sp. 1_MG-2023]|nr:XRE family transcriptional regulator [Granulosicoccaceae sp. 1_MG-2023]
MSDSDSNSRGDQFSLDQYIGMQVKKARLQEGLKITDVARISKISQGMISKIENAQVSSSLDTLSRLCSAIGLPMSKLFNDFERPDGKAHFTKSGEGLEVVRRGTEKGHTYQLLSYQRGGKRRMEPFLISLDDLSEVFPTFSHPGEEFIYLLEGKVDYRHGNHIYRMEAGDSLTFEAEIPHGPERLLEGPIRLLSVMVYGDE